MNKINKNANRAALGRSPTYLTLVNILGIAEFLQHYERPDVKSHVTKSRVRHNN